MTQVVVPVRYPLTKDSKATLRRAMEVADDRDAELTVLHVNLYQNNHRVSRSELKRAVESEFGNRSNTRYVVRTGMLVEETILDEVVEQRPDVVVIGKKQAGRWRKMIRRIVDDPDVEKFLADEVDAKIITVSR